MNRIRRFIVGVIHLEEIGHTVLVELALKTPKMFVFAKAFAGGVA